HIKTTPPCPDAFSTIGAGWVENKESGNSIMMSYKLLFLADNK
ncbi:MAG: hypothetical protein ACI8ZV_002499, partial [Chitinophagales bacterium]